MTISGRQLSILHHVIEGHVERTPGYEYRVILRFTSDGRRICTTTVFALEDLGLVTLYHDGRIEPTERGLRLDQAKKREREKYENDRRGRWARLLGQVDADHQPT